MKSFLRFAIFALALFALIAATLTAVRAAGNRAAPPPLMQYFTTREGTPCFPDCLLGITPGVTSLQAAQRLIQDHPLTARYDETRRTGYDTLSGRVALLYEGDGPTIYLLGSVSFGIEAIVLHYTPPDHAGPPISPARVADLLDAYPGLPQIELGIFGMLLNIGEMCTAIMPVQGRWEESIFVLNPATPLSSVGLYDATYKRYSMTGKSAQVDWRGFASIPRYWRALTRN